uniref:Uncharacterized protein n=1 Tax=Arundo donax TaxID=35708 RepID=A0A0A9AZ49_ARUDO
MAKLAPPKWFPNLKVRQYPPLLLICMWRCSLILAAARLGSDRHGWSSGAEGEEEFGIWGDLNLLRFGLFLFASE